ncbi:16S rRNA (guanine(966)-N(2))-methyltransferase RsmD [Mobilicoccus pelagius]|uniref:Methyltransferase n=1 Tax=Mobilicoccus pelagius NBRC 104925 TaxID=1089455 RepID=H5UNF1_9MICO|nr:16S rRNA (guanine(966)-N(2))-methyltransferase RsmD [Mobilicoccus pelagius]GAB47259.1 hypothetical protein MOPEL_007_00750 [Mobilicoccus pelagius NBRC 104925]
MPRIIAGRYGGRRLTAPTGRDTRPTTDRVRESLFSRLEHLDVLDDAVVLDLYAGSGALGLEAVSRGASRAVLVEIANGAARTLRRNVAELDAPAQIVVSDADRYLRGATGEGDPEAGPIDPWVDVAFLDPPYDLTDERLARTLELLAPLLTRDAIVVVERSARSPEPTWPAGLVRFATRAQGETVLWYAEPPLDPQEEPPDRES